MLSIRQKANTDYNNTNAPLSEYPRGDIRDDPGDDSGTALNRLNHADWHQFFDYLMSFAVSGSASAVAALAALAGAPNGLPDNSVNGYQLVYAYLKTAGLVVQSFIADQTTVNTGTDDVNYVTSLKLQTKLTNLAATGWSVSVPTVNGTALGSGTISWHLDRLNTTAGRTMSIAWKFPCPTLSSITSFTIALPLGATIGANYNGAGFCYISDNTGLTDIHFWAEAIAGGTVITIRTTQVGSAVSLSSANSCTGSITIQIV